MININKKKVLNFSISVLLVVGICFGIGIMPTLASGGDVILLKLAHINPPDPFRSHGHAFSLAFKDYVEATSGGRIEVEVHPGGSLGSPKEILEFAQSGLIQMTIMGGGGISLFYPRMMVIDIPFLFSSYHHAWRVLDSDFSRELMADLPKTMGLHCLGIGEIGGFVAISNSKRPIKTLEDMKGLRIRTMEHKLHMAFFRSLGAAVTPIAFSELYTSLQTGVVDGQMNAVADIIQNKIYEVQDYITVTTSIYGAGYYLVNDKWFGNLPEDLQRIVIEGVWEGKLAARGVNKNLNVTGVDYLIEKGKQVDFLDPEQTEKFRTASLPAVIEILEKEAGREWIDKALEAAKEAKIALDEEAAKLLR